MSIDRDKVAEALPGYDINGELGRGAFGVVLSGRHRRLDRPVAIKQLPQAFGADPEVRRRFAAEARVLAALDHPHIVPIFDYVEKDGLCILVMELLPGGTVRRQLQEGLIAQQACAVGLATCTALDYADERGILHRDIKPDNLLFTANRMMKVTDFGLAKVVGNTMATGAGETLGTPAYMAPEQCLGGALGPATDVYATGVMLYELLSGRLPFAEEGNVLSLLYRHVHEPPRPLGAVASDVPEGVAFTVMRALAKDPADRHPSAQAFGVALAEAATTAWGVGWLAAAGMKVMAVGPIHAAIERVGDRPRPGPEDAWGEPGPRWSGALQPQTDPNSSSADPPSPSLPADRNAGASQPAAGAPPPPPPQPGGAAPSPGTGGAGEERPPSPSGPQAPSGIREDGRGTARKRSLVPWAVAVVAILAAGLAGGAIIASRSSGHAKGKAASTVTTTATASSSNQGSTSAGAQGPAAGNAADQTSTSVAPGAVPGSINESPDLTFHFEGESAHLTHVGVANGVYAIAAAFSNPTQDTGPIQDDDLVLSDGQTSVTATLDPSLDDLPAGGSGQGNITFQVPSGFDSAHAVLTVGDPTVQQVVIPFAAPSRARLLTPTAVQPLGSAVLGPDKLSLTSGVLRFDNPMTQEQADAGHAIVEFRYSFTCGETNPCEIDGSSFLLAIPNGTSVETTGSTGLNSIDPGATGDDLDLYFEFPYPAGGSGSYAVRISYENNDNQTFTRTIPVGIP